MSELEQFIDHRCARVGLVKLADLIHAMRSHGIRWTRARAVVELTKAGFVVGEVAGAAHVGGLSLVVQYQARDGRLVTA